MTRKPLIQLVLAVVAALCCGWAWMQSHTLVAVAPITDGEPVTHSQVYDPPLILLALVLAAVAGVLAVLAGAGWVRQRANRTHTP